MHGRRRASARAWGTRGAPASRRSCLELADCADVVQRAGRSQVRIGIRAGATSWSFAPRAERVRGVWSDRGIALSRMKSSGGPASETQEESCTSTKRGNHYYYTVGTRSRFTFVYNLSLDKIKWKNGPRQLSPPPSAAQTVEHTRVVERGGGGRTAFKGLVDVLAEFCISSLVIICFVKSFYEPNVRLFGPAVSPCAAS